MVRNLECRHCGTSQPAGKPCPCLASTSDHPAVGRLKGLSYAPLQQRQEGQVKFTKVFVAGIWVLAVLGSFGVWKIIELVQLACGWSK